MLEQIDEILRAEKARERRSLHRGIYEVHQSIRDSQYLLRSLVPRLIAYELSMLQRINRLLIEEWAATIEQAPSYAWLSVQFAGNNRVDPKPGSILAGPISPQGRTYLLPRAAVKEVRGECGAGATNWLTLLAYDWEYKGESHGLMLKQFNGVQAVEVPIDTDLSNNDRVTAFIDVLSRQDVDNLIAEHQDQSDAA